MAEQFSDVIELSIELRAAIDRVHALEAEKAEYDDKIAAVVTAIAAQNAERTRLFGEMMEIFIEASG